ncbi:MAG: hypothetical protein KJO34_04280 [Deltaproteobacteria bacterium]|nr:hypothetical protein [Deltaproteobacteria bacterium]
MRKIIVWGLSLGMIGEDWSKAFLRAPKVLSFRSLVQQEAICFNKNGQSVYISSEGRSAPLLRIDLDAISSRP